MVVYLTDNLTVSIRLICDYFGEGRTSLFLPPGADNPSYATDQLLSL